MPIDINNENIVSLTEATKILPTLNGRRPAISTLWRWCRRGLRGVQLEYIRVGRNIATSREALNRFFERLAIADEELAAGTSRPPRDANQPTPAAARRAQEEAERGLKEAGI